MAEEGEDGGGFLPPLRTVVVDSLSPAIYPTRGVPSRHAPLPSPLYIYIRTERGRAMTDTNINARERIALFILRGLDLQQNII